MSKRGVYKRLDVCLVVVQPFHAKGHTDLAIGLLEAVGVDSRYPEDRASRVLVANTVGSLDGDLGLANTSKAFDGSPLAGILVGARRNPLEEVCQDGFAPDKALVAIERDQEVTFFDIDI